MPKPQLNVTPLIDILLVLLIVFMVVAPLKPDSFKAKIPAESRNDAPPPSQTLVVSVDKDSSLTLNTERALGTAGDPQLLIARLERVFDQRSANSGDNIERTVFIKAPRALDYGSVARVVDAVKLAGGDPISLQIDNLE
jgi:biopolymer transport protein ExbD